MNALPDLHQPLARTTSSLTNPSESSLRTSRPPRFSLVPLPDDDGREQAMGLRKIIGQVEQMVGESGDPEGFNAAEWVSRWLESPSSALGGQKPGELMDTTEGQELVSRLIARMQSGAYA